MTELQLPQIDGMGSFLGGLAAGREVKRQKTLADYMPGAMGGDKDAISKIAGVDPDAAMKAQTHAGQLKTEAAQQLVQQAKWFTQAPEAMKPQLYASLVKTAHAAGMDYIPETYDPAFSKGIEQLARVGRGEQFTLSPGSKRFGPDGKVIAEVPFAPANTNLVSVPDGQGGTIQMIYDPRTQQFAKPNYGGMPAPTTGGGGQVLRDAANGSKPLDPVQDFPALSGQFPGVQVSSLARDPRHNAQVGGVGNSFHLTGEAGDFVVPAQQRPQFIAAAKQRGYQAIDEGDHVHLEPPGRGMTASHFGAGQQLGYTPPKSQGGKAAPAGYRWSADGSRLEVIPGGPADKPSPNSATTGGVNSQKLAQANATKLAQFSAADRAIERLDKAAKSLAGNTLFDGGPFDAYVVDKLPQGQELRQAQASLLPILTALTRVPGMGSQSDLESKLASLQMPSAEFSPEVNARAVQALRDYIRDLRAAVQQQGSGQQPKPAPSNIDALLDRYK